MKMRKTTVVNFSTRDMDRIQHTKKLILDLAESMTYDEKVDLMNSDCGNVIELKELISVAHHLDNLLTSSNWEF